MSTVTWSKVIGSVPLLSNRIAPSSLPPPGKKMTFGDPFQGNGKIEPPGRRPSA